MSDRFQPFHQHTAFQIDWFRKEIHMADKSLFHDSIPIWMEMFNMTWQLSFTIYFYKHLFTPPFNTNILPKLSCETDFTKHATCQTT